MPEAPSGTVTVLFTDIEGSTQLLQRVGDRYHALLAAHHALLRAAFLAHDGYEVRTEGDSFFLVFQRAEDAVAAALAGQRALHRHAWPADGRIRVRMGLHTGSVALVDGDYVGLEVQRGARIESAGHGGQILVSDATRAAAEARLPSDVTFENLGQHGLKDILEPEHLYQVSVPDLPAEHPPLRTASPRSSNLPVQRGRVYGREEQARAIRRLLLRDDVGLVTLTGPGGSGKTRLALHVAGRLVDHFEDGVVFVNLSPVRDPAQVVTAIAQQLGVRDSPSRPFLQGILEHLRHKHVLLLLDNFEQVVDAATLVADLLSGCPRLTVLVTSRERLQLRDEYEQPVPPLALPTRSPLPTLDELARNPAVALFMERAVAARPDFTLAPENAAAVVAICVALDGLPLALELAAARVRQISPRLLQARFEGPREDARLGALTGGPRDLPARQRTLRDAIAWSYDLLEPTERVLFRRLSVFVGGFDAEGAETMFGAVGGPQRDEPPADAASAMALGPLPWDPFAGIATLADKSLLVQHAVADDTERFGMLETIREYGLEQLAAHGESETVGAAHAQYYLTVAERAAPELRGPDQSAWLDRLDAEYDNLRAALDWYLTARPDNADGPRLAGALADFWFTRNRFGEGRYWLDRALGVPGSTSPVVQARLLVGDGALARMHNDLNRAATLIEEGAALYEALADAAGVAWALSHLGMVAQYQGQDERSLSLLERAATTYRVVGDTWGLSRALINLGCAFNAQGQHQRAVTVLTESIALKRSIGDAPGLSRALSFLADGLFELGEHDRAEPLFEEALMVGRDAADAYGVSLAMEGLAAVALQLGQSERATALYRESLLMRRDRGDSVGVAEVLQAYAEVEARRGRAEHGVRLFAAAERVLHDAGARESTLGRSAYDRILATLKAGLAPEAFAAAWAAGIMLAPSQAVSEAWIDVRPSPPEASTASSPESRVSACLQ